MTKSQVRPWPEQLTLPGFEAEQRQWEDALAAAPGAGGALHNRSGVAVKALYTPADWDGRRYMEDLGFPGQPPQTRGTYAAMHRGRSWTPRLIVGFGRPEDYNARQRALYDAGVRGLYMAPCNAHLRGYDADEVDPALIGTCGTSINSVDDFAACVDGLPVESESISLGDTAPYTLSAMLLAVAERRGIAWRDLTGTTNQSDYLSHYAVLHMFFRVALGAQRRLLLDHIDFMGEHVPRWNPLSVVGQHMQQAGATPAEAMGLTIASAIQYAEDMMARGRHPDAFLPRFSFFFDISMSFFEEIAKFRAGRRLWARITRQRLGAKDPRAWRFRFHAQTSGVDLTRQQPLNNIARVGVQAMAGIFGGLQSLHTDSYDEALGPPGAEAARIAVATQIILREEAQLDAVIDPLGGSYYVEALTHAMEERIAEVIATIDAAGGMYAAVQSGLVQEMIGRSAAAHQNRIESGEQMVVGVNAHRRDDDPGERTRRQQRLRPEEAEAMVERVRRFKAERDAAAVGKALDGLAAACASADRNVYAAVVDAARAGVSHGEICACVRREMGAGEPLMVA